MLFRFLGRLRHPAARPRGGRGAGPCACRRRRAPRDPDQARPALCQCRDRRRHGIGRGPAPVAGLSPPRGTRTAETMTDTTLAANLAERQQRAKTWFEALRDRICTAFEALEDAQTGPLADRPRSEEHTSELQSLMRISYAVFCLKKKKNIRRHIH